MEMLISLSREKRRRCRLGPRRVEGVERATG